MAPETMTREERLTAAIKLRVPDRVPVVPLIGQWIVPYKKLPRGLRYKDPQALMDAFYEAYSELGGYDAQYVARLAWPQSGGHVSGPSGETISAGKRGIPENFSVQYIEQESIHFEDYDTIINKGWNGFLETYIPRETGLTIEQLDAAEKMLLGIAIDVFPSGRAFNMADGVIRARFRKSIYRESAGLVVPGEVNEYKIGLSVTSHLFRRGHRIRVDVSSSNFPAWARNMNTGNDPGEDAIGIKATQTIFHETGFASYIDLPVVPGK